tara:strand:+ start:6465 stop:6863 length:399 start_codon:yes stop_codon:yes gene_type:complete
MSISTKFGQQVINIGKKIKGETANEMLKRLGVDNLGELKKMPAKELKKLLGGSSFGKKILKSLGLMGIGAAGGTAVTAPSLIKIGQEKQKALDSMPKMNKGGIVAPRMGGKPSHKAKKSSKSIAKKYFKGTF